jgi:hypothetical protein
VVDEVLVLDVDDAELKYIAVDCSEIVFGAGVVGMVVVVGAIVAVFGVVFGTTVVVVVGTKVDVLVFGNGNGGIAVVGGPGFGVGCTNTTSATFTTKSDELPLWRVITSLEGAETIRTSIAAFSVRQPPAELLSG